MTRKDFQLIAGTIAKLDPAIRGDVAKAFGQALEVTNPRFDRALFETVARGER